MTLIPPLYTHSAALLVGAIAASAATWQVQSWRYGEQIDAMNLAAANEVTESLRRTSARVEAINTQYQGALNASRAREVVLRRDVDAAARESDGLREQSAEAARRIAAAPPAAVAEYATAVSGLFADCSRNYQEMAGKASGHAADVRTFLEAWPQGVTVHGHREN